MTRHKSDVEPGSGWIVVTALGLLSCLALNIWVIYGSRLDWSMVGASLLLSVIGTGLLVILTTLVVERRRAMRAREDLERARPAARTTWVDPDPSRRTLRRDADTGVIRRPEPDLGDVRPLGSTGDETRRITPPQVAGPSAAALRPIRVPVFRNEAERAIWAAEHDMPTEVLPVQRDGERW